MSEKLVAACVQNCAGPSLEDNLADSGALVRAACEAGARLVCLPEFFSYLQVTDAGLDVGARPEAEHPALPRFQALARELGAWILMGSIGVTVEGGKTRNRSILLDAEGGVVARYDKVHLFDVDLGGGERYRESDVLEPGERAVVAPTPWGGLGLSICYDLRFAYLYRALAQGGASLLAAPSAFTKTTGQAHWHVLVRARAIETGSFVFAPGQHGRHGKGETYAHSLIVDPWGRVLADAGEGPGYAIAEIDPAQAAEVRRRIPELQHDRTFTGPDAPSAERKSAAF